MDDTHVAAEVGPEVGDGDQLFSLALGEDERRDGDLGVAHQGRGGEGVLAHELGHLGVWAGGGPFRGGKQALGERVGLQEVFDLGGALGRREVGERGGGGGTGEESGDGYDEWEGGDVDA